jgi:hypothetical protein
VPRPLAYFWTVLVFPLAFFFGEPFTDEGRSIPGIGLAALISAPREESAMNRAFGLATSAGLLALCLSAGQAPAAQNENRRGTPVTLDGLQSRAPEGWAEEKPESRFRVKQFRLAAVEDDKDNAEVVIFFFGEGSGGSAKENIKRWKAMFVPPEGKKIDDVAKEERLKINGVPATYFDVHGTYLAKDRPFDPNSPTIRRENYRMIKVVFESKKGPYFFSLIGPAATVAHYKKGFDQFVKGFK